MTRSILTSVTALATVTQAASIRAVGVLGNSGEAGSALVRVGEFPLSEGNSGAAIDRDATLWLSGGDRINRVGVDGRLIESFPLGLKGATVHSRTFAVLDETLYFFTRLGPRKAALFALAMQSDAVAKAVDVELPRRKRTHLPFCLSPQPLNGQLVIATDPEEAEDDRIGVYFVDPKAATIRQAFSLKGAYPHGLAVDEDRGLLYVGARFGMFVGGTTHPNVYGITAVRPDGTPVSSDFPVPCTKTPAIPSQFRGLISLAAGALWETAWYGFLARLDLQGHGAPGRIVQWHHELGYPTQILGLARARTTQSLDPLLVTTPMPDAFYFAVWDRPQMQLQLVRRIGALPSMNGLGLSEDGWVTVGTARTQLWWRWEDPADAVPHKAQIHVALTPTFFRGEQCLAMAAQYGLATRRKLPRVLTVFSHRLAGRNEGHRVGSTSPVKEPVGLAVHAEPGKHRGEVFVSDAATRQIWQTDIWLPKLQPNEKNWAPLKLRQGALTAPTDVAALTDGRLLVADRGRIVMLTPKTDGYGVDWQLDRCGTEPAQRFGQRLRFALDGAWLLVSDTDRHRVLWFDWTRRTPIGQLGATDTPGDDAGHLHTPTLVSLRGTRAVIADSGNQRILKVTLHP